MNNKSIESDRDQSHSTVKSSSFNLKEHLSRITKRVYSSSLSDEARQPNSGEYDPNQPKKYAKTSRYVREASEI